MLLISSCTSFKLLAGLKKIDFVFFSPKFVLNLLSTNHRYSRSLCLTFSHFNGFLMLQEQA